jgi:hypothetical protein
MKEFNSVILMDMTETDIRAHIEMLQRELKRRKLGEFNRKLRELMQEAEAEGIKFIFEEDEGWGVTLTPDNTEAVC